MIKIDVQSLGLIKNDLNSCKNFFYGFLKSLSRYHNSPRYGCFHGPVIPANAADAV